MTKELNLFFNSFDKLAESPGGVQKLRELILQLAVQGKLVPQNPNEEPASELLRKIEAEKEKLIKEGKIKKQKPLPPITTNEVPYKLPKGWEWSRLYEVGLINPRNDVEGSTKVSFVPMNLISARYSDIVKSETRLWSEVKTGFTHFSENDVVMAKITPCFQNGKSTIMKKLTNGFGAGTTELHVFRSLKDLMCPSYVLIYLKSPKFISDGIIKMTGSAGQKRVPKDYFSQNSFPLPPLSEQKRIVAKVDELMALCDQLEGEQQKAARSRVVLNDSAINHLLAAETPKEFNKQWQLICDNFDLLYDDLENVNELREAILQLAVKGKIVPQDPKDKPASVLLEKIKAEKQRLIREGKIKKQKPLQPIEEGEKPYQLPDKWEWIRIGDAVNLINGRAFKPADWSTQGLPIIRIQNLNNPKVPFNYCNFEVDDKFHIKKGDFLISWSGTPGTSFGAFIWNREDAVLNQHIFRSDLIGKAFFKDYLRFAINGRLDEMIAQAHGGVGLQHITKGKLEKLCISLPPFAEQKRIVKKIYELMALCDQLEEKIKQSRDKSEKLMDATIHHLLVA